MAASGGTFMLTFDAATTRFLDMAYQGADISRRRKLSFDASDPQPGETIVDIGCGAGHLLAELARAVGPTGRVIGIDPSADMLATARSRCADFDWVSLTEGSADPLPVPDGAADKAVSMQVFEYLDNIPAALAECHRALRPGGRLVINDIHFDSLVWHTDHPARMTRMLAAWDHHFTERRVPALLPPLLRRAGFTIDRIATATITDHVLKPDGLALMMLRLIENFAIQRNLVPEPEARAWRAEQEELARNGAFFFSLTQFATIAHKT